MTIAYISTDVKEPSFLFSSSVDSTARRMMALFQSLHSKRNDGPCRENRRRENQWKINNSPLRAISVSGLSLCWLAFRIRRVAGRRRRRFVHLTRHARLAADGRYRRSITPSRYTWPLRPFSTSFSSGAARKKVRLYYQQRLLTSPGRFGTSCASARQLWLCFTSHLAEVHFPAL